MSDLIKTKHPRGLVVLFFTEMWERFGYYLMLGILFLYLTETKQGGLGMQKKIGDDIVGTFLALVYITPFFGGLLADRLLGYRKSIIIGAALMGTGYLGLAIPGFEFFWPSIFLIVLGNGFFKPNISTLLGNLYSTDALKSKKDSAYNIFYMGINIGAFVCNFVAAYMKNKYNFGWAFAAAGIGMYVGLVWFIAGMKHIKDADVRKPPKPGDASPLMVMLGVFFPMIAIGALSWLLIPGSIFGTDSTDAFLFGSIPMIVFFFLLWKRSSPDEKGKIGALLVIFSAAIVFWAVFKQNATAFTNFAKSYTHREIPKSIVPVIKPFYFNQQVTMTKDTFPAVDSFFRPILDDKGKQLDAITYPMYFQNLQEKEKPAEGQSIDLVSTEIFQSVNPGFIILLTPLVVGFFGFMKKRNKEPSMPAKIGWGLFITGMSGLVLFTAVSLYNIYDDKISSLWLIGSYGVITIGELFLSPIGLSMVSKVSPGRYTSLMMGGWFLSTAIGNKLSGVLASTWDFYDNKSYYFLLNTVICVAASVAILLSVKWLRSVIGKES